MALGEGEAGSPGDVERGEQFRLDGRRGQTEVVSRCPDRPTETIGALIDHEGARDVHHLEMAPQAELGKLDLDNQRMQGGNARCAPGHHIVYHQTVRKVEDGGPLDDGGV